MDIISILRDHGVEIGAVSKGGSGGLGNAYVVAHTLSTTEVSQKTWNVPVGAYDKETDTMVLYHNTGILDTASWTLTGDAATGYQVNIPDNPETAIEDNNVIITVLRNAPTVPDGVDISGTRLTDKSVPLSKLGQDVQDKINNAATSVVIAPLAPEDTVSKYPIGLSMFNVPSNGAHDIWLFYFNVEEIDSTLYTNLLVRTYRTGNEAVQELLVLDDDLKVKYISQRASKNGVYQMINKAVVIYGMPSIEIVNGFTGGANKAASAETVKILKTETTNLTQEIDKKVEINKFHTNRILDNMGQQQFTKVFYPTFTNSTTTEVVELQIPTSVALQGSIELNLTSGYWNSNAVGTAKVMIHLSLSADGTINSQEINFITMTPQFANNFYISTVTYVAASKVFVLNIHKRQSNNSLQVEMTVRNSGKNFTKAEIDLFTMSVWNVGSVGNYPIQQSIFTHVGNSKSNLAAAITGKGVTTSADDTFAQMVANINAIPTGYDLQIVTAAPSAGQYAFFRTSGTGTINVNYVDVPVADSSKVILMYGINAINSNGGGFFTYNANSEFNGTAENNVKTAQFNHTSDNTIAVRNLIGLKMTASSIRVPIPVVTGMYSVFVISRK